MNGQMIPSGLWKEVRHAGHAFGQGKGMAAPAAAKKQYGNIPQLWWVSAMETGIESEVEASQN